MKQTRRALRPQRRNRFRPGAQNRSALPHRALAIAEGCVTRDFRQGAKMSDKHLSSRFDVDLNLLLTRLLEMGGLVEAQIARAMEALNAFDLTLVEQILESERRLNAMEIEIDEEVSNIIVRRQPTARDLRLLMAVSKCITNLERAGDEARK